MAHHPLHRGDPCSRAQQMAQELSNDTMGFSPDPQALLSDPNNGSVLPTEANTTSNGTWTVDDIGDIFYYSEILFYIGLLVGLFGLVGNGMVIWLLGYRVKRNPFSVYILNLAIVDSAFLLCLSIVAIMGLLHSYHHINITLGLSALFFTFSMAGQTLLMAISTERCLSVTFPIWYKCHRPAHLSTIVCALIWGLSLCLGILWFFCAYYDIRLCSILIWVYSALSILTLLVLCVSSLTLLIRVQGCSQRRQPPKLYRVILLTVLAFLLLGLPLGLSFLIKTLKYNFLLQHVFCILAAVNSAVNPIIYFFVGRQGHPPSRRALRELLQSALMEDSS